MNNKTINKKYQFKIFKLNRINWLGLFILYKKEVMRFISIYLQTIITPIISTILFLIIFIVSINKLSNEINGTKFILFIAPGIIMNTMLQNTFVNNSFSLLLGKIQGNIIDILISPILASELTLALTLSGMTRGLIIGIITSVIILIITNITIYNIWIIILFGLFGNIIMSLMGIISGIWAEKFDHLTMVNTFVIIPITFLSGTFYSINQLPNFAKKIIQLNPFFYLIDGFRYGFIGKNESNICISIIISFLLCIILWIFTYYLIKKGYKLKY